MITDVKAAGAGALGAKTARACDSCLRRRARWFCGADDAFLCHGCDTLVHSANQLASRHERVRLQTASSEKVTTTHAWHSGFTRKARTPRHNKHLALQQRLKDHVFFNNSSFLPVVPELGGEESPVDDETEDQLLLRVPVFDPFDVEPCNIYNQRKKDAGYEEEEDCDLDNFSEFLPSDMDLAEFAADVESLLRGGFDYKEEDETDKYAKSSMVKVKDEELDADTGFDLESVLDMTSKDAFHWNIDSVLSPASTAKEEEEKVVVVPVMASNTSVSKEGTKRDIFLRLNYEEVITAWASQGSPWTTGKPPKFNSDDFWSNCLGSSDADGEVRSLRGHLVGNGDGGREARVSRYREKRRTRLFAKKIRYEVRKLNAEKRPRMKGRFVKRTCFVGATDFPAYH
ncbi:zinc finger protein CONSTANS-LIKE 6-like [Gastrolobium bilobum]|uniref:zinc finger protein CONSTANS-LIKE 6-like n=1 Tax=Gastrolobium bilobum TaxID=150636 RepID=UPI002AB14CBE|nr:zinc finger protein CONSTANS-LIKE 6-like [Gastrolobium bilobum]